MGFAKYHEDNMEMWFDRNRDKNIQTATGNILVCGNTNYARSGNAQNSFQHGKKQDVFLNRKGSVSYAV